MNLDPSKSVAIFTRIQRNLPSPSNINLNLSSEYRKPFKSSHPKSTQIHTNPIECLGICQIHPNNTQTARIHKRVSNNSDQIHHTKFKYSQIYPNPLQCAKRLKSRKICQNQQQIIKIQQNRCKSTRITETTNIYPKKPKPNSIAKLQRNSFKPVPTRLSMIGSQY